MQSRGPNITCQSWDRQREACSNGFFSSLRQMPYIDKTTQKRRMQEEQESITCHVGEEVVFLTKFGGGEVGAKCERD